MISEKEHLIKNLIHRKGKVHENHERHEKSSQLNYVARSFVLFVSFVDNSFGRFIVGNQRPPLSNATIPAFFIVALVWRYSKG